MSSLQASLIISKDAPQGRTFTNGHTETKYAKVEGRRLIVTCKSFYCRDELIRDLSFVFKRVYDAGYTLRGYSNDRRWAPKFECSDTDDKVDIKELFRETNRHFSPMSSPYLLRFVIGRGRANKSKRQWFEDLIERADSAEMSFQRDFAAAWQLDQVKSTYYGEYARMGLDQLQKLTPEGVLSKTKINYEEAFPPIVFKGGK